MASATAIALVTSASAAEAKTRKFNVSAGDAARTIPVFAKQAGIQIIADGTALKARRTNTVRGDLTTDAALRRLLEGTGLAVMTEASRNGIIVVGPQAGDNGVVPVDASLDATPDILVQGQREWSLNLGIERTENDSQPFIVLTSEDIKRSGAPDLETFLRNQLSVNNSAGTASQAGTIGAQGLDNRATQGLSQINLRGFGSRETLILVDGRRQPGVNLGNGTFGQPQITGIPLASIERIEVLAASASSIYGSGASGGAINIVLKRNYSGGEITATYANTDDFKTGDGRIDLSLAKTLEGGRTNITFGGSWRKSLPLLYGDRIGIRDKAVAETLLATRSAANPNGINPFSNSNLPPPGATPNFRRAQGVPLQLKPQYGGTVLSSGIGYIPVGYRGLALDGVAPLLATIGQYNLQAPEGTTNGGTDAPLIYGNQMVSGLLSVRRKMNDWMTLYAQGQYSQNQSQTYFSRGFNLVEIAANAPNNPFTTAVTIAGPNVGEVVSLKNTFTQWTALGGAIFRLPYDWQANLDVSYARTRFTILNYPTIVTPAITAAVVNGTIDLFRDYADSPPTLVYQTGYVRKNDPQLSSTQTTSLRLAGPLPIKLPGGKIGLTLNVERSADRLNAATSVNPVFGAYALSYRPEGGYTQWSAYTEVVLPLISPANDVPFAKLLDIRVSARGERYTAFGADQPTTCYRGATLPTEQNYANCPPAGYNSRVGTSTRSHVDPMFSARWQPIDDVMFRASYGTGYLPPTLAQISRQTGRTEVDLLDPQRGFEPVGTLGTNGARTVDSFFGGNPDIEPEVSKTLTAGIILTPRFVPNLRFSADWTRISKRNNFFAPIGFQNAGRFYKGTLDGQLAEFARFIEQYPDRITRGPASGGYAVGPITFIDFSLANFVGSRVEAVDFSLDYWFNLFGGRLDVQAAATWNRKLEVESYPGVVTNYLGVSGSALADGGFGSLPWRGNGTIRWSKDSFSVGVQSLVFDRYYLQTSRAVLPAQGAAYVPAQTYQNLMLSYAYSNGITLRAVINNVFDKTPPRDVNSFPLFYSRYGDPLGRNFQLSVAKTF
ncbi:TonB-dependent receptor [Sphingomonas sp. CLY1604]|uniref:TonB-dependent receptor n=1 Tax=Sphingomonas sp. CLY1604 TaxID=3457786 RepID=UPI003FD79AC9